MADRQKLIHLHNGQSGKTPTSAQLNLGEIAVNHSTQTPALYIKDNDGNIVEFQAASAINATNRAYADGLIEALDHSGATIVSESNDVISIYPTIEESNGIINITGTPVNFAKVAKTGSAEDVAITDSGDNFTGTTVEGALAELHDAITGASVTIDNETGAFTIGNGLDNTNKNISVKSKTNDYVTVDADGVQLDSTKIDTDYTVANSANLATVKSVETAIDSLDVNGFKMLDIVTSGAGTDSELIIKGIKETDGKIALDSPTNDFAIIVDGKYNNSTNKIATESTVSDAIADLDVTAITGGQDKTIVSISEEDGKISAVYSAISITKSQVSDLGDLDNLYAPKSISGDVETISGRVNTLIGNDSGKTVREIANEELAAQLIPEDAQESLDTLQEIADWIQSHPDDASAMNSAITALSAVSASTRLTTLEGSSHTHENKSLLDGISATQVSNWDTAYANQHTHENIDVLTGITSEKVDGWDEAAASAHTHENKALLDTYTQTESDLADAVSKAHDHENSDVLDSITTAKTASWDNAAESAHTHENKSLLDGISATQVSNWDIAYASAHTHENIDVLTGITSEKVDGWDEAAASAHTHANIDVLTGITSEKVTAWDNAAASAVTGATGDTYVSATVTDNEVNVAATTAATKVFTNAVLGVNTTSSATSANVTVDNSTKLLDFSNLSIDCGEY